MTTPILAGLHPFATCYRIAGLTLLAGVLPLLANCSGGGRTPANQLPVAVIEIQTDAIYSGDLVVLDGAASFDPDGTSITFSWQSVLPIESAASATTQFIAPIVTEPSNFQVRLEVIDANGAGGVTLRSITILPSEVTLGERPLNPTCLAGAKPDTALGIELVDIYPALSFSLPVALERAPNEDAWYLIQHTGEIIRFSPDNPVAQTVLDLSPIVDNSAQEGGLLTVAFDPDFANSEVIYAFFQTLDGNSRKSVLSRFSNFSLASREDLITLTPPFGNHFGGNLEFGADGFLYLTIGDGGSGGDPFNNAQNNQNLFGTMVRIDVSSTAPLPYGIPADNPFAQNTNLCSTGTGNENCPEIYAWGLRNSWRFSFDDETGNLWLGDVGQDAYEEINLIQRGGNYGWRVREGMHCFNPRLNCDTSGLIDPVAEISHDIGQSVTGGLVYRGENLPSLKGKYLFADYQSGVIWALIADENGRFIPTIILRSGLNISHFGENQAGEVFIVDYASGKIFLLGAAEATGNQAPATLSATGCVNPENPKEKIDGVLPYDVNVSFWSDGAIKDRFFALPNNARVDNGSESWQWPLGTVFIKDFYWQDKLIETRLLQLHLDNTWMGYSYAWNSEQTDAMLVEGGRRGAFNNPDWIYPDGAQCLQCHTRASGRVLGANYAQLHKTVSRDNSAPFEQLQQWDFWQLFTEQVNDAPPLPTLTDTQASLSSRARAYLDANCAQCHQAEGPTNVDMDLRYSTSLSDMNICDVMAQSNELNLAMPLRLAPGDSANSMLLQRMNRRDLYAMPPIGSAVIDTEGAALVKQWIDSLIDCSEMAPEQ